MREGERVKCIRRETICLSNHNRRPPGGRGGEERIKRDIRKHVATTSSTPASRQIGRWASMQYCRLQSLQFPARNSFRSSSSPPPLPAPPPFSFSSPASAGSRAMSLGDEGGAVRGRKTSLLRGEFERGASSGIMVLLAKQVHLQNEVGAVWTLTEGRE